MAARLPPALPDEIVEEILARVPPDDPARLVRAALACKRWCRLVSSSGFLRRFRELHPTPPVMGFLRSGIDDDGAGTVRFVPACRSFFRRPRADRRGWRVLNSRNGHVLLGSDLGSADPDAVLALAVWDPVTDELRELPPLLLPDTYTFNAAVLCAAATAGSCGHLDCRREPFLVVFVVASPHVGTFSYVCTSEANSWSEPEPTSSPHSLTLFEHEHPAHAGNALYFVFRVFTVTGILKYDLGTREMTMIHPPAMSKAIVLMTAEGGGLGCVTLKDSRLYLWSREAGSNGDMGWAQSRVIEIETVVRVGVPLLAFDVVTFANSGGVVYIRTVNASYVTDLKSERFRKVEVVNGLDNTIPYISFYTTGTYLPSL
jgi:hypothetical protein